jgi:hypothetical protein
MYYLQKCYLAVHLKHSSSWLSADVKPMSIDLEYAMPWQAHGETSANRTKPGPSFQL